MNPVFLPLKSVWKSILLTAISLEDLNSSIIIEVYMHLSSNYNICHLQYMYKPRGFYLRLPHHFCSVVYFFFLSLYILCGKKKIKKINGTIYIKSYSYTVCSDLNVINLEN